MKNLKCEECAFFDELDTEQPCCYCFDNIHFEEYDHSTEKGDVQEWIALQIVCLANTQYSMDMVTDLDVT